MTEEKLRVSEKGKRNELKQKKDLEQKFKELLEKANGSLASVEENSQVLKSEKRALQERLEAV